MCFRKHSGFRVRKAAGILAAGLLLLCGCAGLKMNGKSGEAPELIPITPEPTGRYHPGKFVWHDLLTPDAAASRTFYSGLFGWSFREHGNYTEILNSGHRIGGIFEAKPKDGKQAVSQWIASISVPDVAQAISFVESQGGAIIHPPVDMPLRGRGALIRDPRGGHLVVLHAKGGDPPDREPAIGDWLWNENWSTTLDQAAAFYRKLGGYETVVHGDGYSVLINEGRWRAGIRRISDEKYNGCWVPVVRVEDPQTLLKQVENLGGVVWVRPGENPRNKDTALIRDNTGALLILQKWSFPEDGQGGGS